MTQWKPVAVVSGPTVVSADFGRTASVFSSRLLLLAFVGMAGLLVFRRFAGAFSVPLEPATAFFCGGLTTALSAGSRWLRPAQNAASLRTDWMWSIVPTVAAVAVGAALSLPNTSVTTLFVLWSSIAVGELVRRSSPFGLAGPAEAVPFSTSSTRRIRQQITRFVDVAGREVVEGTAVAVFLPGQRTAAVHLAFCPPLAHSPEVACYVASGADAEVKPTQSLPYAARFDVKLSAAATCGLEVPVSFSARATASE